MSNILFKDKWRHFYPIEKTQKRASDQCNLIGIENVQSANCTSRHIFVFGVTVIHILWSSVRCIRISTHMTNHLCTNTHAWNLVFGTKYALNHLVHIQSPTTIREQCKQCCCSSVDGTKNSVYVYYLHRYRNLWPFYLNAREFLGRMRNILTASKFKSHCWDLGSCVWPFLAGSFIVFTFQCRN